MVTNIKGSTKKASQMEKEDMSGVKVGITRGSLDKEKEKVMEYGLIPKARSMKGNSYKIVSMVKGFRHTKQAKDTKVFSKKGLK